MSRPSPISVALCPASSPSREVLSRSVLMADISIAEDWRSGSDGVVVFDATGRGGLEELRAELEASGDSGASSYVVVVGGGEAYGEHPELAEHRAVLDLVSLSSVAAELGPRVRKAVELHARLREASRRERDLSLLLELTADYAETMDVEQLLHDVTRRLASRLEIARASLVVLDEARSEGIILAASDDPRLKHVRIELALYPEIREVMRTGRPVILDDAPSHPLLEGVKKQVAARGIQTIGAFPLGAPTKVQGVLLVRAATGRGAFSQAEIDVLTTVSHATAVALRNALRVERLKGQSEREKSARIAAEERATSLERYRQYYAHLSDGIVALDGAARVVAVNPAGEKLLGLRLEEAQGRHINSVTGPEDEQALVKLLEAARRGQPPDEIDLRARTAQGRELTLSVSAAPLSEGSARAILSLRDVTAARRMADELRKTKEFLERLIDSSVDAIIAADTRGRIILFNKGAESISGYTASEARATLSVRDLYPGDRAREVMSRLRGEEHGGAGRLTICREELLTKAGERVPVNMTASIIYEGSEEIATVGIFTDLRDRVQLEQKLSDVETRLLESEKNAVIVALAGTAAHELNQPLTSVMGYAELLRRRLKEDDSSYRPVDVIYREAERMAEIVRKIGRITKYETKAYVGSAQIVDLDKASADED